MLEADTARIYRNVDFEVDGGRVIMRGTVPTDHDGMQLRDEIAAVPGVASVDNQLAVNLR